MLNIKNVNISVEGLSIKKNKVKPGNFKLNPIIQRNTGKLKENLYFTKLKLKIESQPDNEFPVDIEATIVGTFILENVQDENEATEFLKKQAVSIIYPYLRSTVSNLSTTAMMNPVVLPVINTYSMFPEDNKNIQ